MSWLTGVIPRARWILRIMYAVLTAREREVTSGEELRRRELRTDDRDKSHMFALKRIERARLALIELLKVTKVHPTHKISLRERDRAKITIATDASPQGADREPPGGIGYGFTRR